LQHKTITLGFGNWPYTIIISGGKMSYVEDNLLPSENVIFTAKVSPAVFLGPMLSLAISFYLIFKAFKLTSSGNQINSIIGSFTCLISLGFILATTFLILEAITTMTSTEFAVTNKRIIAKTGFIRRNTIELLLTKIESVGVNQNILGRILGFGTIVITGTGGTQQRIRAIVEPMKLRNKINQVVEYVNSRNNSNSQDQANF
jgi:uncharacterized membrane protein YdbT with pleckstrin-like domain